MYQIIEIVKREELKWISMISLKGTSSKIDNF